VILIPRASSLKPDGPARGIPAMRIAVSRSPNVERVVTPLELFFDLVYVFCDRTDLAPPAGARRSANRRRDGDSGGHGFLCLVQDCVGERTGSSRTVFPCNCWSLG
jgi:hypothetical protein